MFSVNPIIAENQLPGNPQSEWDVAGDGDATLQGFSTDISVNIGQTVTFKINDTANAAYHIDIYRIGYYQGNGARKVATVPSSQTLRQVQPNPLKNLTTGLVDAGNWAASASWAVPSTATSGVYLARLVREDTGGASHIPFVVRNDNSQSDLLFQTSDTTWQAYNQWGGYSLYLAPTAGSAANPNGLNRAYAVSYNRPINLRGTSGGYGSYNSFFHAEYPMVRWLEANGYNVSYFSGIDTDRLGSELREHKVFLSVGHDEYWSGQQRANVEAARDAGVNLAFFSGNESFWKTRWQNSTDSSNTPYRTLVCYKESKDNDRTDPLDLSQGIWTGTWRDPRFSPPADGGRPENAMSGTAYMVDRTSNDIGISMQVPATSAPLRFWRNTAIANLQTGQVATIGDRVVGYETDEDLDNGFRPAGLINLSATTFSTSSRVVDISGTVVGAGTSTHQMTLYRASSGALVFGAGTVQWSWGLDGQHDDGVSTPDASIRQSTVNLLADMSVQPATPQPGIILASISTDLIRPTATITSPAGGASLTQGSTVTISGTAADTGGGVVAAVEVSTDGGFTWHRANGKTNWTYTWVPTSTGTAKLLVRAVDDSLNLSLTNTPTSVTIQFAPTSPTGLVAAYSFNAGSGTVLADSSGNNNNGTISGATWTTGIAGNGLLFNGTNSWVTIPDANSLDLTSGMTLEAWVKPTASVSFGTILYKESSSELSYALYGIDGTNHYPAGYIRTGSSTKQLYGQPALSVNSWSHLALTYNGTTLSLYVNGTLVSTQDFGGSLVTSTGVLRLGGNSLYGDYFQGILDEIRIYNRALNQAEIKADLSTPVGGSVDTTAPSVSLTAPTNNSTVSGSINLTTTATDNYVVNSVQFYLNGQPLALPDTSSPFTFSWNTLSVPNGTYTLTAVATDPAGNSTTSAPITVTVANAADTTPPTGKFYTLENNGYVSGQYVLWVAAADNRSVAGVQFQLDGVNLGSELTRGPFNLLWNTTTATSGAHMLSAVIRDTSGNLTTVPVSITVDNVAPSITGRSPAPGAVAVSTSGVITVTFSEDVQIQTVAISVLGPNNVSVDGTLSYDSAQRTVTFTPIGKLATNSTYSVTVSGAKDLAGNSLASPSTWSFTTSSVVTDATFWDNNTIPSIPYTNDTSPIEVGLQFRPAVDGYVAGVRFYKGVGNDGPHIGHLWTASGTLLATVTFTGETASGWEQALFSSPVAVSANTTYVVSYYAPNGGYASTANYFTTNYTAGSLTAPGGANGVYRYGTGGGFPNQSFSSTNYWVDLVFSNTTTDTTPPTVTGQSPTPGATNIALGSIASATFSEAVQAGTIVFTLTGPSGAVAATISYDSTTRTVTLTPSAALAANTTYTANLSGAKDLAGNTMTAVAWSFTTSAAPDTTAPSVTGQNPSANATGIAPSTTVSATFSEAVQSGTIVLTLSGPSGAVAGSVAYNSTTNTATFTPTATLTANTTYTVNLSGAKDLAGNTMTAVAWSFTTGVATTSLWPTATPAVLAANDSNAIELGVKFTPATSGNITGIRFYKGSTNTGTHVGHLWTASGTLLGTVTFSNESASGWQTASFASPIAVSAGVTYVASYYAPVGRYSADSGYFATAFSNGGLTAPAGSNGVYRYGTGGGFPNASFNSTNYWVDVVYTTGASDTTPPAVTNKVPAVGATGIVLSSSVSATFSEAVQSGTIVLTLSGPSGAVAGSVAYNSTTNTATFTPTATLTANTTYTVNLSGAKDLAGNTMTAVAWSFTTEKLWIQTTTADFAAGTLSGTTTTNGGVALLVSYQDDFAGSALDSNRWTVGSWTNSGGGATSAIVSGGTFSLLGGQLNSVQAVLAGPIEGLVQFAASPYQHFGLATGLSSVSGNSWAMFSTGATTNTLFARLNIAGSETITNLGALPTGFHNYKIVPIATGYQFYVDGVLVTTATGTIPSPELLKAVASDFQGIASLPLVIDWVRVAQYPTAGVFISSTFDAGISATWGVLNWTANVPTGTSLVIETSTTNDPNGTWSGWVAATNGGAVASPAGRYIRFRVTLSTSDAVTTPELLDLSIRWS